MGALVIDDYFGGGSVTVRTASSYDRWGAPQWSAPTAYPCRVQYKRALRRNADGKVLQCEGTAFLAPSAAGIPVGSQLQTADGRSWLVLDVELCAGGARHTQLHFGNLQ